MINLKSNFTKQLEQSPNMPLRDAIYNVLRNSILEGVFAPGERVTEDLLAKDFECSRTPVREALRKLENDGLLTVKSGIGIEISTIDEQMVKDEFDIRRLLELYAVEKACERITMDQIKRLEWATDKIEQCLKEGDYLGATQANIEFHELLFQYADNHYLKKIKDLLWVSLRLSFLASRLQHNPIQDLQWDEARLQEHRDLIKALSNKDQEKCLSITEKHVYFSYEYCLKFIQQRR